MLSAAVLSHPDPFDQLACRYDLANALSFGIADRARRFCIDRLPYVAGARIAILMSGTGLDVAPVLRRFPDAERIVCMDRSQAMCERAQVRLRTFGPKVEVLCVDVLEAPDQTACFDAVVINFGLKTLTGPELQVLSKRVRALLVPGGSFCACEFALADRGWINAAVRLHTRYHIPGLVAATGADPRPFALLWDRLHQFDPQCVSEIFAQDFELTSTNAFGGLVRSFTGYKR
jgi:ubiquinone/menaquinone biosynthesis C-methylase UbiE